MTEFNYGKRQFLLVAIASATLPFNTKAAITTPHSYEALTINSTVRLHNIHTKETLTIEPDDFAFDTDKIHNDINHFFRDYRANAECKMDMKLIAQLSNLQSLLKNDATIEVISGYRTQATNQMLRKKSKNVARKSYHVQGRAIDIRILGTATHHVRDAAISMCAGGVGYYAKSNFVHLDTGPFRHWG